MFYNVASILLGIAALCLPLIAVWRYRNNHTRSGNCCILASFSACLTSIVLQLAETLRLIEIDDISAIMDTTRARLFAAAVLAVLTVLLCGVALLKQQRRK